MAELDSLDIPQVRRLEMVRQVVELMADDPSVPALAQRQQIDERTTRYRLEAARQLGLLGPSPDWHITERGRRLRETTPRSAEEHTLLREAYARHPAVVVIPELLDGSVGAEDIGELLEVHAGLAPDTARKRAEALVGWRKQLGFGHSLFPGEITPAVIASLRDQNPWWQGRPDRGLPTTHRGFVSRIRTAMARATPKIVVVRGPRQVGKSTAIDQIIQHMLTEEGTQPSRILRVQFDTLPSMEGVDDPVLSIARWFQQDVLGETFNEVARRGSPCWLFLDEIQHVKAWAAQIKSLTDHHDVRVIATGSSALHIKRGQETLAGRTTEIDVGTLSVREIALFRGLETPPPLLNGAGSMALTRQEFWLELRDLGRKHAPVRDEAFRAFSDFGAYPFGHVADTTWEVVAEQLRSLLGKVTHDIEITQQDGLSAALIEAVFRHICRYAGDVFDADKVVRDRKPAQADGVKPAQIDQVLTLLEDTLLLRAIRPHEYNRQRRFQGAKFCLSDHGLRAALLGEITPLAPSSLQTHIERRKDAGKLAESVAGAWLSSLGDIEVGWLPPSSGQGEIDLVARVGACEVPFEIKYQREVKSTDGRAIRTFLDRCHQENPDLPRATFGVIVTLDDVDDWDDPRIVALPLSSLLLMR